MIQLSGPSRVVAVAGASGGIGQHVVEGLLREDQFKVVALLRRHDDALISQFKAVNPEKFSFEIFDSSSIVESLTLVLKKNEVDTFISCLANRDGEWFNIEKSFLQACLATGVKRFSYSNFAGPMEKLASIRLYAGKLEIIELLKKHEAEISWTGWWCGMFMNYLGAFSNPKPDGKKATGHLKEFNYVVDVGGCKANFVGEGKEVVGFTLAEDVGQLIAKACRLKEVWNEDTGSFAPERLSWLQVVKLAENVRGKAFEINSTPVSEVKAKLQSMLDQGLSAEATFGLESTVALAENAFEFDEGDDLKQKLAREGISYKITTVDEFLNEWWTKA